jgi:hypothetical protein
MNWAGDSFCAQHVPYQQMASEYLELLYDLMGKEWRDEWIDQRYPDDKDFNWESCYNWAKNLYEELSMETGLLSLSAP